MKDNYEELIHNMIKNATVLNEFQSPCNENFLSNYNEEKNSKVTSNEIPYSGICRCK